MKCIANRSCFRFKSISIKLSAEWKMKEARRERRDGFVQIGGRYVKAHNKSSSWTRMHIYTYTKVITISLISFLHIQYISSNHSTHIE